MLVFQNLHGGVKQIAEFLGFSLPDEKIQSIAENSTFQSMSSKSQETHGKFAPMLSEKVHLYRVIIVILRLRTANQIGHES